MRAGRSAASRPEPGRSRRVRPRRASRRRRSGGGLTGRALVLGAVLVMMALILASPLQQYLQQRHALSQAEQARTATSARVAVLRGQLAQWSDPRYVEQQARARLQLARPGDTVYVVVDPAHAKSDPSTQQNVPVTTTAGPTSWQTRAWTTLQVADAAS